MKNDRLLKRAPAVLLALILATGSASALFGGKKSESPPQAEEGAPIAREIEIATYRNIPYRAQFLSTDPEGEDVTYAVVTEPKKGTVTVEGADFVYTPKEGKTGSDVFTYAATDSAGHVSNPAAVDIIISKTKSGVAYADTDDRTAAPAQALAEAGIFTGSRVGDRYCFEPDRAVSRSEFLAMAMETAGAAVTDVTMTGFCDDAAIPTWAKSYAAAGLTDGLVRGVSTAEGMAFRGEEPVTYSEAASMLDRLLSVGDVDLTTWYADRDAVPSWAAQAVGNMEFASVLSVGSFGSEGLERPVTRGDAARMLCAASTLLEGEPEGLLDWLG